MTEKRLPPIERPSKRGRPLLRESDPAILQEYAEGLWTHWGDITGGKPTQGYPKGYIEFAAVWLLSQYVDEQIPPPYELFRLFRAIVDPDPERTSTTFGAVIPKSRKAWDAAVWLEAGSPPDPRGKNPSTRSTRQIARILRELELLPSISELGAENTVRDWRRDPTYRTNVEIKRALATSPRNV